MKAILRSAAVVAAALLWNGACANTATCDPNERFKDGMCLPMAAQSPKGDAGADAAEPVVCTPDAALTGEFGRTCTVHGECGCPAPICAVPPGQTQGFCTQVCPDDPSVCPSDFRCIDLSAIDPSYPKTCLPSGVTP
jgi:hypothetical protein